VIEFKLNDVMLGMGSIFMFFLTISRLSDFLYGLLYKWKRSFMRGRCAFKVAKKKGVAEKTGSGILEPMKL